MAKVLGCTNCSSTYKAKHHWLMILIFFVIVVVPLKILVDSANMYLALIALPFLLSVGVAIVSVFSRYELK
jgi:hypothetical protein